MERNKLSNLCGLATAEDATWPGGRRRAAAAMLLPLLAMPNSVHKTKRRLPPDTSVDGDANAAADADVDADADQVTFYWRLRASRRGAARHGHFLLFRGMKAAAGPHMDN